MHWYSRIKSLVKTAAKRTMFHGTSSKAISSILTHGLIIRPPTKVYPAGEEWAAFPGIYLAEDIEDAQIAAANAVDSMGGNVTLIEIQVETRTAVMDEDFLPGMGAAILSALRTLNLESANRILVHKMTGDKFLEVVQKAADRYINELKKAADVYIRELGSSVSLPEIQGSEPAWERVDRARPAIEDMIWTALEYYIEKEDGWVVTDSLLHFAVREKFDKFIRQLPLTKEIALRVPDTIGFRGANRILSIAELILDWGQPDPAKIKVHYGKPSLRVTLALEKAAIDAEALD
jgi:hypothetical protein